MKPAIHLAPVGPMKASLQENGPRLMQISEGVTKPRSFVFRNVEPPADGAKSGVGETGNHPLGGGNAGYFVGGGRCLRAPRREACEVCTYRCSISVLTLTVTFCSEDDSVPVERLTAQGNQHTVKLSECLCHSFRSSELSQSI